MRKYLLLLLSLLLVGTLTEKVAYGQVIMESSQALNNLAETPHDEYGTLKYKVYYETYVVPNKKDPDLIKSGTTLLGIGEEAVLFQDYNEYRADSILKSPRRQSETINAALAASRDKLTKYTIVTLPDRKKYLYQTKEVAFATYRYEETLPVMDWDIREETKQIGDLTCQRAMLSFGGREWEAWFAPDLPVPYGPYLMHGLPGLILELSDADEEYHYIFAGMEEVTEPEKISLSHTQRLQIKSREEVRQIIRNYMSNPGQVIATKVRSSEDNSATPRKKRVYPYNPIELN